MKQDDTVTISKNGEPTEVIYAEYLDYRRAFEDEYLEYFTNITESPGTPFLNKFSTRNVSSCKNKEGHSICGWQIEFEFGLESCIKENNCKYEITERLQVVEIYFDTPTFDKITKDAKTNDIAKLSMIGGTLGLLTGE